MMLIERIMVQDRDGRSAEADLAICECGSKTWLVDSIRPAAGVHQHLQCAECGTSYCDGTCSESDTSATGPGPGGVSGDL